MILSFYGISTANIGDFFLRVGEDNESNLYMPAEGTKSTLLREWGVVKALCKKMPFGFAKQPIILCTVSHFKDLMMDVNPQQSRDGATITSTKRKLSFLSNGKNFLLF